MASIYSKIIDCFKYYFENKSIFTQIDFINLLTYKTLNNVKNRLRIYINKYPRGKFCQKCNYIVYNCMCYVHCLKNVKQNVYKIILWTIHVLI